MKKPFVMKPTRFHHISRACREAPECDSTPRPEPDLLLRHWPAALTVCLLDDLALASQLLRRFLFSDTGQSELCGNHGAAEEKAHGQRNGLHEDAPEKQHDEIAAELACRLC